MLVALAEEITCRIALAIESRREALPKLVDETCQQFVESAREKGVHLTWSAPNDTPAVMIDRGRIIQVLTNLIGNALEFTPTGGRIEVGVERAAAASCSSTAGVYGRRAATEPDRRSTSRSRSRTRIASRSPQISSLRCTTLETRELRVFCSLVLVLRHEFSYPSSVISGKLAYQDWRVSR
jgi:signal transduction histidine kinase